jgi:dolichol-phosphate mannosyltransferase
MDRAPERPRLTVGIPIYNESETIPELGRRLQGVLDALAVPAEVILVNDGSTDDSRDRLRELAAEDARFKLIDFSRNFGHQAALFAAMTRASGDAVVLMDGDLQDPPELIPRLLAKWEEGYEVVLAVRRKRKEGWLKRAAYSTYYRLLRSVAYVPIPADSGDFSLMDRRIVRLVCDMPERNKFLRGLRAWAGFRQTAVEYERDARYAGETKYTLPKLFRLALDGLVSYSFVPLRLAFVVGAIVSVGSFALAAIYFFQRIFSDNPIPRGFTTIAVLVLFLGGVQLLTIGIIGEYLGRIYDEVKRRPEFVVRETIGLDD